MNTTSGTDLFTMEMSANEDNATLTDLTFEYSPTSVTAPLASSQYLYVTCVDMVVSDFSPSAAQTGLLGIHYELKCHNTCTSLAALNTAYPPTLWYGNVFDWDLSTLSTSGALSEGINFHTAANTDVSTTPYSVRHTIIEVQPQMIRFLGLPTTNEDFYYKCWSKKTTTAYNEGAAISDISTSASVLDVPATRAQAISLTTTSTCTTLSLFLSILLPFLSISLL
ncbi:unnamed protein product [Moneuplotes crassus]|uniref:Uncharacterized protein n=1 Tax=Euplotes crassus TaxID=5936 RepID=A0AAD1XWL8_EUPCR|nr:unnamed protein product [Moneuplotes crassus]